MRNSQLHIAAVLVLFLVLPAQSPAQVGVEVQVVEGFWSDGQQNYLSTTGEIVFGIRYYNYSDSTVGSFRSGYRLTATSGVQWDHTWIEGNDGPGGLWHFTIITEECLDCDGVPPDLVAFNAMPAMFGGMPHGYDEEALRVGVVLGDGNETLNGNTLCIDSSFFPPNGNWLWSYSGFGGSFVPAWNGPLCYEFRGPDPDCCSLRGDADGNGTGPDIADLVYMVAYAFSGGLPVICQPNADIDNAGLLAPYIADIVYLVNYMFDGGPGLDPCP